jgi:hypothetical protein
MSLFMIRGHMPTALHCGLLLLLAVAVLVMGQQVLIDWLTLD